MAKKVLSIVIGTQVTQICEVSYNNNKNRKIHVYKSISFPTPENAIEDGYIRNKELFGESLQYYLRAGKFKSNKVIFSVSSTKIANREVILPPIKDNKIMDVIRMGASDYFPIDIKEYILSYSILEKKISLKKEKKIQTKLDKQNKKLDKDLKNQTDELDKDVNQEESNAEDKVEKQRHIRLSVYAVPSTLVKNYYSFARMLHLEVVSIDYYGNSSYQLIKRQVNRGTNVVLQINEQNTLISILRDDVLILQRIVGYGTSVLAEAVMEQDYYKVENEKEALDLLKKYNLLTIDRKEEIRPIDSTWTNKEAASASEYIQATGTQHIHVIGKELAARQYIIESLQLLTNSIARMIDYYKANHKNSNIEDIYLSGVGIEVKGIEDIFASAIGITPKKIETLSTIRSWKKAVAYRNNPSQYMACIGAAIKPVDFVPKELSERKEKISAGIGITILILTCLIGAATLSYVSYIDCKNAKKELEVATNELAAISTSDSASKEYEKAKLELADLQMLESLTTNKNDNIDAIIEELEKKLPTNTVIHSLQFSGTGINMNVSVADNNKSPKALVAKVLLQLKTIDYFKTVDISDLSVTEEEITSRVSFSIACTYTQ